MYHEKMANYYSLDLRKKVMNFIHSGGKKTEASKLFNVARDTIYRWIRQYKKTGNVHPNTKSIRKGYKLDHDAVVEYILKNPNTTQVEVAKVFGTYQGVIRHICLKYKITRKKRHLSTKKGMIRNETIS